MTEPTNDGAETAETLSTILTYAEGKYSVDLSTLPPKSVLALARRGWSHLMGSEVSSKVKGKLDGSVKGEDGTTDTNPPDEDYTAATHAAREANVAGLIAGTIGTRVGGGGGATRDPVESEMAKIARSEIVAIIKGQNGKVPTGDKTYTMADGAFTMAQLIERRIGKHGDRLRKAAEKVLKARTAGAAEAGSDL